MKKVLAVILGLIFVAAACNNNPAADNSVNNEQQPPAPVMDNGNGLPPGTEEQPAAEQKIEIMMTSKGFEPANITVKKGTKVTFVNKDNKSHWPASAPHPTHTIYPQFDPKAGIAAGKSWNFTFDRAGEWKFHDHLLPTFFGSVTVTE